MKLCYKCGYKFADDFKPGRRDECPKCTADVHVCLNCTFYDNSYNNDCRETSAERVVDKEKSNFCSYFSFKTGNISTSKDVNKAKEDFNNLFSD